jgi:hypothetical protein
MNIQEIGVDFGGELFIDVPEEQDDKFRVITPDQFIPELENEVKRYLLICGTLPKNTIKYEHVQIPTDLDKPGFQRWALEEIRRCKEGHNGMPGKMYFFFNYCYIQKLGKKIRPQFRVIDNEWFKFIEACQKSNEWGIICVKRRRVGASWKEAADALHDCLFNTNFNIGLNSKSDRDSILLFQKVKFLYDNLPGFLRVPTTASNTKNYLDFSYITKDQYGNKQKKGNFSTIMAVAPTDNAYEGMMLSKWICDEAGKIKNLATMWQYTEDCLMQETRRVGIPIIFGTAGDIGAEGKDLEYMWQNAHQYKLKRFFFSGWMGLNCDEYGNDSREDCIRWVVYERFRRHSLRAEELNTFIQKYPLTVAEAFTVTAAAGVGNVVKIRAQMQDLFDNPPQKVNGFFKYDTHGSVIWVPDPRGKAIIYEHPKSAVEGIYLGGADPADHDDAHDEASDLSMYILKRQTGTDPARIVFEYTDRPADVTEYYEQAVMACIYFNNAKLLIERNRFLMIKHFSSLGYKYLLARTPSSVARIFGGKTNTLGVQMTPATKEYMKGLISEYIEDYYSFIPSRELLEEFLYFGARNTDKAMAFGIALLHLQGANIAVRTKQEILSRVPHFGYKNINGSIVRIVYAPKQST